jgi:hypothetical protein
MNQNGWNYSENHEDLGNIFWRTFRSEVLFSGTTEDRIEGITDKMGPFEEKRQAMNVARKIGILFGMDSVDMVSFQGGSWRKAIHQ